MVHAKTMAALQVQKRPETRLIQAAVAQMRAGVEAMATVVRQADSETLGVALIQIREVGIDPLEAAFADGVRALRQVWRVSRRGRAQHRRVAPLELQALRRGGRRAGWHRPPAGEAAAD
jgi:hypothetical protein